MTDHYAWSGRRQDFWTIPEMEQARLETTEALKRNGSDKGVPPDAQVEFEHTTFGCSLAFRWFTNEEEE